MTKEIKNHDEDSHFPPYYRLGVGLMILNQKGLIFTGKRLDLMGQDNSKDAWQMPQGGIDYNEEPYQAAFREMKEEIGTENVKLIAESKNWYSYNLPKELAETLWSGRFDGQTQKWFLFEFTGYDSEINIQTRHPEFAQWKWMTATEVLDSIVPFKKELYHQVFEEFKPFLIEYS